MTDNEKIQSFGDMVSATEKLTKPWRISLIVTNILWAIVLSAFILLAYLTPVEMEQGQEFDAHTQSQSYSEGFTNGN